MTLRPFMALYALLWTLGLPLALAHLLWRSRRDADYRRHLAERFGRYRQGMDGAVWVHAASLGEVRAASPLVRALLDRGDLVVMTHLAPAGRREAQRLFAADIAAGRAASVWLPFDTGWTLGGFFGAFRPRLGLVIENEHWPRMILAARTRGIPLYPCNARYPLASWQADRKRPWRRALIARYAGALVKSELQAGRFRDAGLAPVTVTGETRFDLAVPPEHLAAAPRLRGWFGQGRAVVTFASTQEVEDALTLQAIALLRHAAQAAGEPPPAILYVPRRAERFDATAVALRNAGLRVARRSEALDVQLVPRGSGAETDVLLCDSVGEMAAFIAAADRVVVGGGFSPRGIHNIIEPLALGRPVVTGPATWPYEYPFAEAAAAGLAVAVADAAEMARALRAPRPDPAAIAAFVAAHSGAVARTLAALDSLSGR